MYGDVNVSGQMDIVMCICLYSWILLFVCVRIVGYCDNVCVRTVGYCDVHMSVQFYIVMCMCLCSSIL